MQIRYVNGLYSFLSRAQVSIICYTGDTTVLSTGNTASEMEEIYSAGITVGVDATQFFTSKRWKNKSSAFSAKKGRSPFHWKFSLVET